jgi:hypothetical protein
LNISQNLLRHPIRLERRGQPVTDRPGAFGGHQLGRDTEPGMIIHPVNAFAWQPSANRKPPTTSI